MSRQNQGADYDRIKGLVALKERVEIHGVGGLIAKAVHRTRPTERVILYNKKMRNFSAKKLLLDLLVIACFGIAGWIGYRLFVLHTVSSLIGSVIFIASLGVSAWAISVLRGHKYRWNAPSFPLVFFCLLGLVLILAFAGLQPFAGYKDALITRAGAIWGTNGGLIPGDIATVESKGFYLGSYDIWFTLRPQSAVPGVSYVMELYERGRLRDTKLIRFSDDEVRLGRVKEVTFQLEEADFTGLSIGDLSIFSAKVVPSSGS